MNEWMLLNKQEIIKIEKLTKFKTLIHIVMMKKMIVREKEVMFEILNEVTCEINFKTLKFSLLLEDDSDLRDDNNSGESLDRENVDDKLYDEEGEFGEETDRDDGYNDYQDGQLDDDDGVVSFDYAIYGNDFIDESYVDGVLKEDAG
ncbi:MAG: hypothetical protein EZS28_001451 [Streblomastix strix]|uniref:Uncharacterized protein n=1 Tax=Streblomastix strix TaxID=222440 RepID=A0A5J4X7K6_9EUKA|nr:MAG: hypothetical protein EZS28_001451 [Streblomastix strix]